MGTAGAQLGPWHAAPSPGVLPAPARRCHSLKRSGEDKEQRLTLLEAARAAAEGEVSELRAALRGLERARLESRRELQELRRQVRDSGDRGTEPSRSSGLSLNRSSPRGQVKELDSENSRRGRELGELQARVALEEQREQRSRREASGLRQKVAESEAGTEAARKEVRASPRVPKTLVSHIPKCPCATIAGYPVCLEVSLSPQVVAWCLLSSITVASCVAGCSHCSIPWIPEVPCDPIAPSPTSLGSHITPLHPRVPHPSQPTIPPLSLPLPRSLPQLQQLQQRLAAAELEFRQREQELSRSLEEARGNEKKLLADARNLQLKVEAARAEVAELGLRLSAAQGRAQGLEAELARGEEQRRATESRLGGLQATLLRTVAVARAKGERSRDHRASGWG